MLHILGQRFTMSREVSMKGQPVQSLISWEMTSKPQTYTMRLTVISTAIKDWDRNGHAFL